MLRSLLLLIGLYSFPLMADAEAPMVPLPTMLSVFVCQTVAGHHVEDMARQGVQVFGAPNWVDLDWAYDNSLGIPLKVCERTYVAIHDQTASSLVAEKSPIPVNPDASDPSQCSWLAMQIVGTLKDPGVYVACPRPVYNSSGMIVAYTDPPCPPDCSCSNEPQDL